MATTLQGIRDFARNTLQTDDTDLPNSLVDVYSNEAMNRIIAMRSNWPHLYAEGTLAMVSGTQKYVLASASFNPQTFIWIESVWDDGGPGTSLRQMDYQEATATWIGPSNNTSADPAYFALYGGNVYLYPKPSATRSLRVAGYRTAAQMSLSTDVPDLPSEFHNGLMYGVAAIAYAQQEDQELSSFWGQMANQSYQAAIRNLFFHRRNHPVVAFGRGFGTGYMSYNEWVRRNAV